MTAWRLYHVVLRLRSRLHVGHQTVGNLKVTSPYVSGNVLWGALTARLARGHDRGYEEVGRLVHRGLALGYSFPSDDRAGDGLWPWSDPARFAWRYLSSYSSTSLETLHGAALLSSLHEVECIRPRTPDGRPVCLSGWIAESTAPEWVEFVGHESGWLKKTLDECQLGGERRYGWGRVEAEVDESRDTSLPCGLPVDLSGHRPVVSLIKGSAIHAHAAAESLEGVMEPLVSLTWDPKRGPGHRAEFQGACFIPGSTVSRATSFEVANFGIWRPTPSGKQ